MPTTCAHLDLAVPLVRAVKMVSQASQVSQVFQVWPATTHQLLCTRLDNAIGAPTDPLAHLAHLAQLAPME